MQHGEPWIDYLILFQATTNLQNSTICVYLCMNYVFVYILVDSTGFVRDMMMRCDTQSYLHLLMEGGDIVRPFI